MKNRPKTEAQKLRDAAYKKAMEIIEGYSTCADIIDLALMLKEPSALYFVISVVSFLPDHTELELRRALADKVNQNQK